MITAYEFIDKKRRGMEHTPEEIRFFINGYVKGEITDYQAAAWLMAVCLNGMTDRETVELTLAMAHSGNNMYSFGTDGFYCDKHSTGGVGDKVTLFAAPVCAACGIYVPKMSGRGLGFTGGTIDKLEAVPGFETALEEERFLSVVKKAGCAVAGQTGTLVPADKKLYALRSVTATTESIPLICSSIMSKKIVMGADGVVLDVKVGDGAFMKDEESAEKLARLMISVGEAAGQKCSAVLTDMSKPLGYTVGNAVEVVEAIEALHGKDVPSFHEVAYEISAQMLLLSGYGTEDECRAAVENAVKSGAALERMRTMIALQGGDARICDDPSLLGEIHKAKTEYPVYAQQDGYISGISCEKTGMVSLKLGAGRENKTDPIDMSAGIVFSAFVGDHVKKGDLLATLRTSRDIDIEDIASEFSAVFGYCENEVIKRKNVIKVIKSC